MWLIFQFSLSTFSAPEAIFANGAGIKVLQEMLLSFYWLSLGFRLKTSQLERTTGDLIWKEASKVVHFQGHLI